VTTKGLAPYSDWGYGIHARTPSGWTLTGDQAGGADLTSPDESQSLPVRVIFTAPQPTQAERTTLADQICQRLFAALPPGTTKTDVSADATFHGLRWRTPLPDGRTALIWAAVEPNGVVRTAVGRFPPQGGTPSPDVDLNLLLTYVWFGV
jgi:hypothetical protein